LKEPSNSAVSCTACHSISSDVVDGVGGDRLAAAAAASTTALGRHSSIVLLLLTACTWLLSKIFGSPSFLRERKFFAGKV
jgi:hypothetical protein